MSATHLRRNPNPNMINHHLAKQRQMLAMMGITPWVSRMQPTINVADVLDTDVLTDDIRNNLQPSQQPASNQQDVSKSLPNTINATSFNAVSSNIQPPIVNDKKTLTQSLDDFTKNQSTVADGLQHQSKPHQSKPHQSKPQNSINSPAHRQAQAANAALPDTEAVKLISPFILQGMYYNNWALLVDVRQLNPTTQKLWQNMQMGLCAQADQLNFPFCKDMCTLDLANASLAGFVLKLAMSKRSLQTASFNAELIKVAALTTLPEDLDHEQLLSVPTLDEMITTPALKRQFWQLLSA